MSRESTSERWVWRALFGLLMFAFLYFVPYFQHLNNPNENSRVYQVRSAVEQRTFAIDSQLKTYGWVNDLAVRNGKHYQCKAPGPIFLAIPAYAALRPVEQALGHKTPPWFDVLYFIRLFVVLLPSLGFLYLFRGFLRRQVVDDSATANALTIVLGLGTLYFSYALIFVNHTLSAAVAFGALMAMLTATRTRVTRSSRPIAPSKRQALLFVAGMLLAGSTSLDYATFPISAALLLFALHLTRTNKKQWVAVVAGAAIPSLLVASYHQVCWGSPFRVGQGFLENPVFAGYASKGVFGFGHATAASVVGVLFSSSKGLLFFSPFMVLGLLSVVVAAVVSRQRLAAVLSFGVVLWMLLYNVSLVNWDGGWTVGPRYVTVIAPFVVYSVGLLWAELGPKGKRWFSLMAGALAVPSMVATTLTSVMFPHLQPEFRNPIKEFIWPLWRDGYTPWSWGRALFGFGGRTDQVVYLFVFASLVVYVVVAFGWMAWRKRRGAGVSLVVTLLLVMWSVSVFATQMLPSTENEGVVRRGRGWVHSRVWQPSRSVPPRIPPRSRHGR